MTQGRDIAHAFVSLGVQPSTRLLPVSLLLFLCLSFPENAELSEMALSRGLSSTAANLTVNNCSISDPAVMANLFNEFFTSISSVIVDEINPSDRPPDENISNEIPIFSFFDTPLSVKEVIDAAMQLQSKKTLDFTGLSVWFV